MSERAFLHRLLAGFIAFTLIAIGPNSVFSAPLIYKVKEGETLGAILFSHGHRRLWCIGCAVEATSKRNSLSNPNLLQIGQEIVLNDENGDDGAPAVVTTSHDVSSVNHSQVAATPDPQPQAAPEPSLEVTPSATAESEEPVSRAVAEEPFLASELFFGVPLRFVSLKGVDRVDQTSGSLLSNLSPGFQFGWRLQIDPKWQTAIFTRYEDDAIQPDIANVNIENRNQKVGEIDLRVRYGENVRVGLGVKARDRLAYRAATGAGIRVQTLPMISAQPFVDGVLYRYASISVQGRLGLDVVIPNGSLDSGLGADARVLLRQDFERWALEAEFGYEASEYQTKLLKASGRDLWLTWGLVWKL